MFRIIFTLISLLGVTYPLISQGNIDEDEVIYHVVQRSFYDSNGDRHGDLNGLRKKLDYLQELGVTSILLLPLYHSEYYHNYFATDFKTIDPEFGTMEDYLALVRDIHKRGMKLYMDMETQYVTEDHEWYKDSYRNPPSQYTDYLIYNGPDNTEPESIIFNLTELEGYNGVKRKITTVNLLNQKVLKYNTDLFSYWVDPNADGKFDDGVDGFRLDHMMDDLDWKGKFTDLFARFWTPLIDALKEKNANLTIIAEQANWSSFGDEYIEHGNVDRVFAFRLLSAITSFDKERIMRVADSTFSITSDQRQVIVFIENHDIQRFASAVAFDSSKLRLGAAFNLLLGGTPSIYYGQEIGMSGSGGFGKYGMTDANDIPMREAFEWSRTTSGKGMALWYKDTGPWWDQTNVKDDDGISYEEQKDHTRSLWNTYHELLALRKEHPALAWGSYLQLENDNITVCSFLRETSGQQALVVINLSEYQEDVRINWPDLHTQIERTMVLFGKGDITTSLLDFDVTIPAYGIFIVQLTQ